MGGLTGIVGVGVITGANTGLGVAFKGLGVGWGVLKGLGATEGRIVLV